MKEKLRKGLFLILALVFVISSAVLLRQFGDNAGGEASYADALAIASGTQLQKEREAPGPETGEPAEESTEPVKLEALWVPAPVADDPLMEEMAAIDLAALREVNGEVLGWIRIPETKIDYPLMQGQDNDYYLNHTWDRQSNSVGSIFLEHRNSSDLTDYNTIVYGHNMKDGAMFAGLHRYASQQYWQEHPYIYIATGGSVYRYEVFASYKAEVDSAAYGLSFHQLKTKANFLRYALEKSNIQTQIIPEENDRILTLSTCSGAGYATRWVVHARLKMVEAWQ